MIHISSKDLRKFVVVRNEYGFLVEKNYNLDGYEFFVYNSSGEPICYNPRVFNDIYGLDKKYSLLGYFSEMAEKVTQLGSGNEEFLKEITSMQIILCRKNFANPFLFGNKYKILECISKYNSLAEIVKNIEPDIITNGNGDAEVNELAPEMGMEDATIYQEEQKRHPYTLVRKQEL